MSSNREAAVRRRPLGGHEAAAPPVGQPSFPTVGALRYNLACSRPLNHKGYIS
jgi:hypothetical protein